MSVEITRPHTSAASATALDRGYRRLTIGRHPHVLTLRLRSAVAGAALGATVLAAAVVALGLGSYPLSPAAVIDVLSGGGQALDRTVVFEWRLPRTLAAIVLGAYLAVAGALFQTVTRNPLVSPDILGLSNGAFTGMLLAVVFVSSSWAALTTGAVVGGVLTAGVIVLLAGRMRLQGFRVIVIGIGVAAMLASANTWMLLQVELETAMFASAWGAGSLNGVAAAPVVGAVLCGIPPLVALVGLAPHLRQLDLGDDVARATGARPSLIRRSALTIAVLLVAIATAVIGPIAFIALAAPQIARRVAGTPYLSLTMSALVGAALLLASDIIAQHILPVPLPAGVVTVSVGGLYLVLTLVQEIRRRA